MCGRSIRAFEVALGNTQDANLSPSVSNLLEGALTGSFQEILSAFFGGGAGKHVGTERTLEIRYLERRGSAEICPFLIITC